MGLKIEDITAFTKLELDVANIPQDDKMMLEAHNTFKIYMEKYVPMLSGNLRNSAFATPKYVEYPQPDYAEYMYYGVVYGPNFLVEDKETGETRWVSPKGKGSKHPTGRTFNYSKPHATHHWDQALMANEGDKFTQAIATIINRKLQEDINNG